MYRIFVVLGFTQTPLGVFLSYSILWSTFWIRFSHYGVTIRTRHSAPITPDGGGTAPCITCSARRGEGAGWLASSLSRMKAAILSGSRFQLQQQKRYKWMNGLVIKLVKFMAVNQLVLTHWLLYQKYLGLGSMEYVCYTNITSQPMG